MNGEADVRRRDLEDVAMLMNKMQMSRCLTQLVSDDNLTDEVALLSGGVVRGGGVRAVSRQGNE